MSEISKYDLLNMTHNQKQQVSGQTFTNMKSIL